MTERQFQREVITTAHKLGWRTHHTADSRRANPGWPDLALWKPGRFMLRELKLDNGRLSVEQIAVLQSLRAAGVDASVWRPDLWPLVEAELLGREAA